MGAQGTLEQWQEEGSSFWLLGLFDKVVSKVQEAGRENQCYNLKDDEFLGEETLLSISLLDFNTLYY